ncbi:LANO_0F02806g1_1 [Lachancea nothofagi CBS 11611]|uniref:LANO_0F02806g1_1 n=1 Tax=Lachancea nothofagi CBS 11611 TaxID=1266666 RepID=A0A1G4K6X5_9SACH|nr:LANO_0F02806g1_1 [Lachancea nothofagi CBS 11611]
MHRAIQRQQLGASKHLLCRYISVKRSPPRSLLQRQAKRRGDIDPSASSQLVVTSLKDIFSIFQPASQTQEDDEMESSLHTEKVIQRIETGELRRLYLQKFSARQVSESDGSPDLLDNLSIPGPSLIQNFPRLSQEDRELIDVAVNSIPPSIDWRQIPLIQKQVLFYIGYGSYGPRESVVFMGSKPQDFTWRHPAKSLGPGQKAHKLPKEQIINVWTCTPERRTHFDSMKKGLDPGTRAIALIGIMVAIWATFREYQQRSKDENMTQVAQFVDREVADLPDVATGPRPLEDQVSKAVEKSSRRKWYQLWR